MRRSRPWPLSGVQINATVPVRAFEFARKRHNVPGPKRDGLLAKRLWDRRKDEWTPDHSTPQYQEKQNLEAVPKPLHAIVETASQISPALPQDSILHWAQNLGKRSSSRIRSADRKTGKAKASERIPCYGEFIPGAEPQRFVGPRRPGFADGWWPRPARRLVPAWMS